MGPDEARTVLHDATWRDDGTFTILRLGEDPGVARTRELRLALRVLWRHWKTNDGLPFDITSSAASILHFRSESERNLATSNVKMRDEIGNELSDISQGAFELLFGPNADAFVVRRQDLDE